MTREVTLARLEELEAYYREAKRRHAPNSPAHQFQEGREFAVRDLRIELFGSRHGNWHEREGRS